MRSAGSSAGEACWGHIEEGPVIVLATIQKVIPASCSGMGERTTISNRDILFKLVLPDFPGVVYCLCWCCILSWPQCMDPNDLVEGCLLSFLCQGFLQLQDTAAAYLSHLTATCCGHSLPVTKSQSCKLFRCYSLLPARQSTQARPLSLRSGLL